MADLLSRSLEYLLLLLVAVAVAVLVIARYGGDGEASGDRDRTEVRTEAATEPGTTEPGTTEPGTTEVESCQEAGITLESQREGTCRTESATLTIVDEGSELVLPQVVVRVTDATAELAQTPTGRAAERMRVTVPIEVRNPRGRPYELVGGEADVYLVAGEQRIPFDRAATALPGALAAEEPIAPGSTRSGVLRFELAGAQTRDVLRTDRAQLGVRVADDRIGVVRLHFEDQP